MPAIFFYLQHNLVTVCLFQVVSRLSECQFFILQNYKVNHATQLNKDS